MNKTSVGVIIGRFQTPRLHEGHDTLMKHAQKHSKQLVCVGVPKVLGTPRNPLDFQTIEQMIKEKYPRAVVMPLPDQPTNEGWTKKLNEMIKTIFRTDSATIYCGRANSFSSVQDGYKGPHKLVEIDEVPNVSATELRKAVGRSVEVSEAFRRGVIYGATNQYTRCDPVVDICVWRQDKEGTYILLGSRFNENGKLRLPGGHVDASDIDGIAAAKRELFEETGLSTDDYIIIGNYRITSMDSPGYAMFTTLYLTKHIFGNVGAADDLDGCKWINIDDIHKYYYADDHEKLVKIAVNKLVKLINIPVKSNQSNK